MNGQKPQRIPCQISTMDDIRAAQARIAPYVPVSPVLELPLGLPGKRIFIKNEAALPGHAFKIRGAANAILSRPAAEIARGVSTVSSGNMAIAMAIAAERAGVPMVAWMYDHAPRAKIAAVESHGGTVRIVSDEVWWSFALGAAVPPGDECYIYTVTDQAVIDGHGTLGLEIASQLPDVDVVLTPYGGGGMTLGVASALHRLRHKAEVVAVEAEAATPVTAALAAGHPVRVHNTSTFVKSIGSPTVVADVWACVRQLVRRSSVVSGPQIVEAMGLLFEQRLIAEGAGAAGLAAAIHDPALTGNILCILSGANIDAQSYADALNGRVPD